MQHLSLKEKYTQILKNEAYKLGFSFCGVSKSEFLESEEPRFSKWLSENRNGKMAYMQNHFDKRLDPSKLVEGSKSVVSLLYNYYTYKQQNDPTAPQISKYAFGEDYHIVVKDKLKQLVDILREQIGDIEGRAFVDSAPLLEKAWAAKSGLGWIGKNANLINKGNGSFFFLAELIVDVEFEYDHSVKDYCGNCTACIDACPTQAIYEPHKVDGSRCISYFTIELKDSIPNEYKGRFGNWAFGCDVCQDVCPWNRFSKPHHEPRFDANPSMLSMNKKDWIEITEDIFEKLFKNSPLTRTKYNGLLRNIDFITNE